MNGLLDGSPPSRVAIITGGSRGIGRASVLVLAARGYAVVVDYLHDQRAAETIVDLVLAANGIAVAVRADVADEVDVARLFAETTEAFGGIDVVIHTVGGQVTPTPLADVDVNEFDALCRSTTRATFLVNRQAARHLRDAGSIVNLSSSAVGSPKPGHGAIAAAKASTDALTRVLALELRARDITVNVLALDVDKPCPAELVAETVAYLLTADGHDLTGEVIPIDEPRYG
jgi:3-oxoacyl-[acyl-carrier protein] reductase